MKTHEPLIAAALELIDEAFEKKAWHGPNLRGTIRGLGAAEAAWRPGPGRHSIQELVVHAAYWKYAAWRRLTAATRGSFPLDGSNWFVRPQQITLNAWREDLAVLEQTHRTLRRAIADLSPRDLDRAPAKGKLTRRALVTGVAAHDLYHAGQIQLLKKLAPH